jgi:hypothetical protein
LGSIEPSPNSVLDEEEGQEHLASPQAEAATEMGTAQTDTLDPNDAERYQIMLSLLEDFTRATDELYRRLSHGDYEDKVFAAITNAKRNTFHSLLPYFLEPNTEAQFTDPEWVEGLDKHTEVSNTKVLGILWRANIATALDGIVQLEKNTMEDTLPFLNSLDSAFMRLFTSQKSAQVHWKLALDLRTCLFLETLAASSPRQIEVRKALALVFCKDTDSKDYAKILSNGPFKSLTEMDGAEPSEEENELISQRTEQLYALSRSDKVDQGLRRARQEYSLNATLNELQRFLTQWYTDLKDAERGNGAGPNGQTEPGRESWHDAEETLPDSYPESQSSIVRPREEDIRCVHTGPHLTTSSIKFGPLTMRIGDLLCSRANSPSNISNLPN